jgi:Fe2+ or Zn2+ uptake regulation protein
MKLDRNRTGEGRGKYGLLKTRRLEAIRNEAPPVLVKTINSALALLEAQGLIDWGDTVDSEFFVLRLKDQHAGHALSAYAHDVYDTGGDVEYAQEVHALACKAGRAHPNHKRPD